MAEENVNPEKTVNDPAVNQDDKKKPDAVPYFRFKEIVEAQKQAEERAAKLEAEIKKAEEKKMEEDGRLKDLLAQKNAELEAAVEKAKQWDEFQATRRQALIEKLPEEDRELYEDLPLLKLEKVVEKLTSKPNVPRVDNSSPAGDAHGYKSLPAAALDYSKGRIDKTTFQKIKDAFTARQAQ